MVIDMSVEWLERIERKIDAQGREHRQMAAVLDTHTSILESHTRTLESHTWLLESHSEILGVHGEMLRSHAKELLRIGVIVEKLEDDLRGVAEGVIGLGERMDRQFVDVLARLDERAAPIEAASRHFASKLADHERRLLKRPPGRRRR